MTRLSAAASVLLTSFALGQSPAPSGTVSAEAVEYVRAKPDFAKLYLKVETRNPDPKASADDHQEAVKKAVEGIDALKLKGVKVSPLTQQVARMENEVRGAAALGQPRGSQLVVQYLNSRQLLVSIAESNPEQLEATVVKVQQEATKLGLTGDVNVRGAFTATAGIERGAAPQVVFGKRDGWDDLLTPAVEKATKRAVKKAELLAVSAGLKPGEVLSVSDGSGAGGPTTRTAFRTDEASESDETITYSDGELLRKVRVRVVLAAGK